MAIALCPNFRNHGNAKKTWMEMELVAAKITLFKTSHVLRCRQRESTAHWKSDGISERTWPCLASYLRSCHAGGIDWHRGCWCWWWDRWGRCQGSCWGHSLGRCSEGPSMAHRGRTLVRETRPGGFRRAEWDFVLFSLSTVHCVIFGVAEETATSSGFISLRSILDTKTWTFIHLLCWFV